MRLQSKVALATLALVIGSSQVIAGMPQRDQAQDPSPDQSRGPGGFRRGGPDGHMGPDGGPGRWERDGGGMRRGMRGRGGRGEGPRRFGLGRLLSNPEVRQQIGVTADQAAKIRQQESDFRKAEIRNRADLEIKRMDLHDLLSADKPDRAAIDSKLQEISAAQLTLAKLGVDFHITMRDALTPAQRQKLEQWMKQSRQPESGNNAGRPRGPRGGGSAGPGGRGPREGSGAPPNAPSPAPNQ
ncbi:MAG: periplasmic heavy metal sensor [Candidatus Acidiferrales bacterium]